MKKTFVLFTLAAMAISCTMEREAPLQDKAGEVNAAESTGPAVAEVLFSEELSNLVESDLAAGNVITRSSGLNALKEELGILSYERIFPDAGEFEARTRAAGLHRWYRVTYSDSVPATKAMEGFRSVDGVVAANPVRRLKFNDSYNDPLWDNMWQFSSEKGKINITQAWEHYTRGSENIIVAVVDLGVDLFHEDLAANCIPDKGAGSYNFVENNPTVIPGGHGTHCAGIISAVNNNGIGISSLAGGDYANGIGGVKILSLEIAQASEDGKSTSWGGEATAIKYAADHGAVICSNSWGYVFEDAEGNFDVDSAKKSQEFFLQPNEGDYSNALKAAIDYFIANAGKDALGNQTGPVAGGIVLFSAGNEGQPFGVPACYPPVIAVGATSSDGLKASYSNYGDWVDIGAPGSNIMSTIPDDQYASMSGTSMACPMTAGAAALVASYYQGTGFTADMLKERILQGADYNHFGSNALIGPFLDPMGALNYGSAAVPEPLSGYTLDVDGNSASLGWNVGADSDGKVVYAVKVIYGSDSQAVLSADPANPGRSVKSLTVTSEGYKAGDRQEVVIERLDFETTYYFKLVPFTYNQVFADATALKSITTGVNHAPVITCNTDCSSLVLTASSELILQFTVTEPDSHAFTVSSAKGSDAETFVKSTTAADVWNLRIYSPAAPAGSYSCVITATDEYGLSFSMTVNYTLLENSEPEIREEFEGVLITGLGVRKQLDLSKYFSDPDGDNLSYAIKNSSSSTVHAAATDGQLYLTSMAYGVAEITVTASDPRNDSAVQTLKVLVKEPGNEVSAYPNPVQDTLYIGTGEDEVDTSILVASSTGSVVYNKTTGVSAFNPAVIDMTGCAPGKYSVTVKYAGNSKTMTVIKK